MLFPMADQLCQWSRERTDAENTGAKASVFFYAMTKNVGFFINIYMLASRAGIYTSVIPVAKKLNGRLI